MKGLTHLNIELTSRCNKNPGCWMCGRRKLEREHPELCDWGDMPIETVYKIAAQTPPGITVQFHWNGEPLLYLDLLFAIVAFKHCITGLDTNGILLLEKQAALANLDTLTISIVQDDPIQDEQFETVKNYLELSKKYPHKQPLVIFRMLGNIRYREKWLLLAKEYNCLIANRVLHSPNGSRNYQKPVTIPEMGICLEMLYKLAIDRYGNVYPCVRFDPKKLNKLANIKNYSLSDIWNSDIRKMWVKSHIEGRRQDVPLCAECDFYGVPIG